MNYEKQQLEDLIKDQGEEWLNRIQEPQEQLSIINQLINIIILESDDIEQKQNINKSKSDDIKKQQQNINSILRCLKKLNDEIPELVKSQIISNKQFPKSLIKYYTSLDYKGIIVEGLIILQLIFGEKTLKQLADGNQIIKNLDNFANSILNAIEYFKNGEIFQNLALIIMKISNQPKVIKACVKHKNINFILEYIPLYINNSGKQDLLYPLLFTENILDQDGNIFHPVDFKNLQILAIRHIVDGEEYVRQLSIRNLLFLIEYGNQELLMKREIKETVEKGLVYCKDIFTQRKGKQILDLLN